MGTDSKYWEIYITREEWVWDPTKDYICLDPLKISNFAKWTPSWSQFSALYISCSLYHLLCKH